MTVDVLIIGAGLTGLTLASLLKRSVTLLEKSKGLGGRIATRRIEDLGLDHGAPYLTFCEELNQVFPGVSFETSPFGAFVPGGMTKLPKALAGNLDIHKGVRATQLKRTAQGWEVCADNNQTYVAKKVVITAPLPQALELLESSRVSYPQKLTTISYTKAVMALIITGDPAEVDKLDSHLHSIELMASRGLHPRGYVVRGSETYSEEVFDRNDEVILSELLTFFKSSFSAPPVIVTSELKKWRYVLPKNSLPDHYLEVDSGLFLAGDAFRSPDSKGSLKSAFALAEKL